MVEIVQNKEGTTDILIESHTFLGMKFVIKIGVQNRMSSCNKLYISVHLQLLIGKYRN